MVGFTSSEAIMSAVKAGRSKPFMLGVHELVVEDGCRTDIAYANFMVDCQLVVEEKRALDERKRSTEAAKKRTEATKKSPNAAEDSREAEKESVDVDPSQEEKNLRNIENSGACGSRGVHLPRVQRTISRQAEATQICRKGS